MASVKQIYSGIIAAPIEDVFRVLTDPKRIPEWLPACTRVEAQKPTLTKGTRFKLHIDAASRRPSVVAEVIEYSPPAIFGWAETAPRAGSKTFYRLQFNGSLTGIVMQHVSAPSGLLARLRDAFFTRRQNARHFERSLQNLQKILMP